MVNFESIIKKGFSYLMVLLLLVSFTSCIEDEEYKTPDQYAIERQTEIMECFINKDKETLKSFFSEYIINKYPDIDSQIDEAFNFLDGEIVSYDEPYSMACGSPDRKGYGGYTLNILTDKKTEYKISFTGWLSNSEQPDNVGVIRVKIANMTSEYDNNLLYIGEPD